MLFNFPAIKTNRTTNEQFENFKWTDEETAIIRKHNTLPAKKLWKLIKKTHSLNSVSFKKIKEKKYAS